MVGYCEWGKKKFSSLGSTLEVSRGINKATNSRNKV